MSVTCDTKEFVQLPPLGSPSTDRSELSDAVIPRPRALNDTSAGQMLANTRD